jgi:hypothetical protein
MSGSKLLEQAIVDAQALRDSAFKTAQATLLEKFAPQVKEAVEKLLEQEEEQPGMAGSPEDALAADIPAGTDFGGAPPDVSDKGYVAGTAGDIPLAATDGEKLCPCPDDEEEVTLELNLADLASQLQIGKETEMPDNSPTGMMNQPQAMGGATQLQESSDEETSLEEEVLELDEMELDENIVEMELDEADIHPERDGEYEGDDPKQLQRDVNKAEEEELKNKKKADLNKDGKLSSYEKKRGKAIEKAMGLKEGKIVEQTSELLKASQVLLKEVENKEVQINKLLEENKKYSSIIEEMSQAFKKLDDINLLNAKLFYENQVLKSASLNERQKTHIAEAISKADTVNEAKAVYETLISSVGGPAKEERSPKSLNEAISKKSSFRLPHKQVEQPADPGKDRWLRLAGIK